MVYNFKPLIMFVHESTFLMNKNAHLANQKRLFYEHWENFTWNDKGKKYWIVKCKENEG